MKLNSKKLVCLIAVLALVMAVMAGCGGDKDAGNEPANSGKSDKKVEAPATELTEEEYKAEIDKLTTSMANLQNFQTELQTIGNDPKKLAEKIDEIKEPFDKAAALNAPAKYKEAQVKIKSGCEAFSEYFDYCKELMEKPEKANELGNKITELMTTAQTDFAEGLRMVQEL